MKKNKNTINQNIIKLFHIFVILFLLLIIMNTYWAFWREKELLNMTQNPRNRENLDLRGGILSMTGEYLAKTVKKKRVYPEGEVISHITGYLDPIMGKSGLENSCDEILRSHPFPFTLEGLKERWNDGQSRGYDIYLTLDIKLTRIAYEALGNHRGAIVAISPQTGEILIMVSKPGFDTNNLYKNWENYKKDPSSPLLDRTVQGSYIPGSIFKVLILASALEEGIIKEKDTFHCPGYIDVEGHRFNCGYVHGHQDLRRALANSCNVAFATIGLKMGRENLLKYFKKFFGNNYDISLPVIHSKLTEENLPGNKLLAQSSFGQGEVLLTPFEACLMTCVIANKGKMMYPYLIKEIKDSKKRLIKERKPEIMSNCISTETAEIVSSIMESVVEEGTGYRAKIEGIRVAGKTGTAEHPGGENNAWFVGFAPAENPKIAVAVIIEEGGAGGEAAAPVAGKVMYEYLKSETK
ncbi:MAG TPA: penicillin-binding transpeptidase domain-containing protein [Candidatus Eremiobacteraeota bacterium]|nr:penicillin-binding transpeptidase domain-containing protein [Candidatus Eremiobacteraeota bacterium]